MASNSAGGSNQSAGTSQSDKDKTDPSSNVLLQSKDAQTMIAVLKDMGIEEFEPRVINQLLEFSYRYTTNLLEDAKAFSTHAGKKNIDSEDIKMAIKSKVDYSFTTTAPRDLLMEISKTKNKNPLPPIKYHSGIRLPPDRFCLHAPNYLLKTQHIEMEQNEEAEQIVAKSSFQTPQVQVPQRNELSLSSISMKRPRADEDDYDI